MGRYRWHAAALAAVLVVTLAAVVGLRERRDAAALPTPSPTPSASASPAATASATTAPSSTASPAASPLGVRYVSALLGYSVELPPPWHRSICNDAVTQQSPIPLGESYFGVLPRDFTASDIGSRHPSVQVLALENPQGLSPRQWVEAGRPGAKVGARIEDTVYAGRPAVRSAGTVPTYLVEGRGRMYIVGPGPFGPYEAAAEQTMLRIVESFRFITDAEQAAARAALPTAPPARTPEQVADGVAAAFAAKDTAALSPFLAPCMLTGGEQAGGTSVSREKYLDDLRAAFTSGLTVTVRARPIEGDRTGEYPNLTVSSTWQDARGTVERKLMLRRGVNDRWEWHGTIERLR